MRHGLSILVKYQPNFYGLFFFRRKIPTTVETNLSKLSRHRICCKGSCIVGDEDAHGVASFIEIDLETLEGKYSL